ncbi:BED-type domain-containing protein [Aphis craccivora]|uniref:BED-type domain-containing protein n=1 Tax=Aphis craccivora TaxID=307492 RepID=A0A6G0VV26_APHCR|nr:BED-type domain-containing protein [Aphis craccivora]
MVNNYGDNSTCHKEFGNHDLVFMWKLLGSNFNQTIGVFASKGDVKCTVLVQLVLKAITLKGSTGLLVEGILHANSDNVFSSSMACAIRFYMNKGCTMLKGASQTANLIENWNKPNVVLLSQTAQGLRVTLHSTIELSMYLLEKCDLDYVLTGMICQDDLEMLKPKISLADLRGIFHSKTAERFKKNCQIERKIGQFDS